MSEETVARRFDDPLARALRGFGAAGLAAIAVIYLGNALWGFLQATIVGLVFGAVYAASGRLWLLIAAHAAFDLTALAIIYLDLEREVAGLLLG